MYSLMYFGVKNTRLRSLAAANPPLGLGWLTQWLN